MMSEEESKYRGMLVIDYVTKHIYDNNKPTGTTYHEKNVTFCCAKMEEVWGASDRSLSLEFGQATEDGYFYSPSCKVGVFMVTKDPGWYGDVSHDHTEIVCCPFCAGKFTFNQVKQFRVDRTCKPVRRTYSDTECITKETEIK